MKWAVSVKDSLKIGFFTAALGLKGATDSENPPEDLLHSCGDRLGRILCFCCSESDDFSACLGDIVSLMIIPSGTLLKIAYRRKQS